MKTQKRQLMWHGMLLFLLGLTTDSGRIVRRMEEAVFWNLYFVSNDILTF